VAGAGTLIVGAVLVDSLSAPTVLLAARRTGPEGLAGRWEFPGGKVEPGERPEDALRRELREELGIDAELGAELPGADDGSWPLPHGSRMRLWFATSSQAPQTTGAHDELRWLAREDLLSVDWLDADLEIVTSLATRLG